MGWLILANWFQCIPNDLSIHSNDCTVCCEWLDGWWCWVYVKDLGMFGKLVKICWKRIDNDWKLIAGVWGIEGGGMGLYWKSVEKWPPHHVCKISTKNFQFVNSKIMVKSLQLSLNNSYFYFLLFFFDGFSSLLKILNYKIYIP